ASLPSSASALEIAQTARQTFCHLASTHSTMGKLTTLNCGATPNAAGTKNSDISFIDLPFPRCYHCAA
ncbi:MAG: hypothetical protein RBS45_10060, partial [Anaerolineales bacterium]|nr:hypothetical protein [Anaerolineales bacterium]